MSILWSVYPPCSVVFSRIYDSKEQLVALEDVAAIINAVPRLESENIELAKTCGERLVTIQTLKDHILELEHKIEGYEKDREKIRDTDRRQYGPVDENE